MSDNPTFSARESDAPSSPRTSPGVSGELQAIALATQRVIDACDAIGITRDQRATLLLPASPRKRRKTLRTLEEFLLACEALALVSGPEALALDDMNGVEDEVMILQKITGSINAWGHVSSRRPLTSESEVNAIAERLRALMASAPIRAAFEHLADCLAALTAPPLAPAQRAAHPLISQTSFVSSSILLGALALLIFSIGSTLMVTQRIPSTRRAVSNYSQTVSTRSSGTPGVAPTVPPNSTATVLPISSTQPSTTSPTPQPVAPLFRVSALNTPLCPSASFTITYVQGKGSVSVTATSPDSQNIALGVTSDSVEYGQVSASVVPGQTLTVYVEELNDGTFVGQIAVTFSDGSTAQEVKYNTSNCTGFGG